MAWIQDGRLAIALVYGSDAQWVKNIMAAGGGTIVRRGRELPVRNPRIVTADDGEPLPRIPARMSRRMGVLVLDLA